MTEWDASSTAQPVVSGSAQAAMQTAISSGPSESTGAGASDGTQAWRSSTDTSIIGTGQLTTVLPLPRNDAEMRMFWLTDAEFHAVGTLFREFFRRELVTEGLQAAHDEAAHNFDAAQGIRELAKSRYGITIKDGFEG